MIKNKYISSINLNYFPLKSNIKLLDYGFGDGSKTITFAKLGIDVTALDVDKTNIKQLKIKLNKNKINNVKTILMNSNNYDIPLLNDSYDRIILNEVLEHVPDTKLLLRELYRILKIHGLICISIPTEKTEKIFNNLNSNYLRSAGHIHIFNQNEIINILNYQKFKINHIEFQNFQFTLFWYIQSIFKINPNGNGKYSVQPKFENIYWKMWGLLNSIKVANNLLKIGNKILPKSIYIYVEKN
jgi:2-polyprenyl-3-methyl-5-hydroxy-6-metoxy-1,4-benzoquinol methylase